MRAESLQVKKVAQVHTASASPWAGRRQHRSANGEALVTALDTDKRNSARWDVSQAIWPSYRPSESVSSLVATRPSTSEDGDSSSANLRLMFAMRSRRRLPAEGSYL